MNEGLAALKHLNKNIIVAEDIDEDFNIIEKELQALEIIGEKIVQLDTLFSIFTYHKEKENSIQLTLYNSCVGFAERKLTQAQFDLLKEVLL